MSWSDANAKCRWYTPFPLSQQSAELNESTNGLRLLVIPGVQVVKGELTARVCASP